MFGTTEANSIGTILASFLGVGRSIGISEDIDGTNFIDPIHERLQISTNRRRRNLLLSFQNVTCTSIQTDKIAFLERLCTSIFKSEGNFTLLFIDTECGTSTDAWLSPTSSDDSRMTGHTTTGCQNSFSGVHAFNIIRRRLITNQNGRNSIFFILHYFFICHGNPTDSCSRRRRKSLAHNRRLVVLVFNIGEAWMQQLIQMFRQHLLNGLVLVNEAILGQIDGNLDSSFSTTFSRSSLQHE
mmetsp:Transcript_24980/g.45230  ORF Transcript_24980/g.45230 Transcript_24980/m.45230 type:complete len:241 (+) Transcript_24980:1049-1771(+)